MDIRHNWTQEELLEIHNSPLFELIYRAMNIHQKFRDPSKIQVCSLISIKTGGCPEDCHYCPQAARYHTDVKATGFINEEAILEQAKQAIKHGASRICLGAAIRSIRDGPQFDRILNTVKKLSNLGVEVCCTLGMLSKEQAKRLKQVGLFAYNHNLDTSKAFYPSIITTRSFEERLATLEVVEEAGLSVCCGGIIGMGETIIDRVSLLRELATRTPHPDSVPINWLMPVAGTPLEKQKPLPIWDMVRMIATARIAMPKSMIRLSAGRLERTIEEQALCFLAGANSIHAGEKLLTRPNPSFEKDLSMFTLFGLKPL
jgi:biotin synthase